MTGKKEMKKRRVGGLLIVPAGLAVLFVVRLSAHVSICRKLLRGETQAVRIDF